MNEKECPTEILIFVARIANEDDENTIGGRFDLHINVKKEKDGNILVEIEPTDLDSTQQAELANKIEEILNNEEYLDSNRYKLNKNHVNPIRIKFNGY
jgi:predicted transcriptional regulator